MRSQLFMLQTSATTLLLSCVLALPLQGQQADPPAGTLPEQEVVPGLAADQLPEIDITPDPNEPLSPWLRGGLEQAEPSLFEGGSRSRRSIWDDPSHRTRIDLQQLQERMPGDMFQALEREVGVLMQRTQRGAAAPFIRGLTGQQVLILIDGIRLNNATFRLGPNQYFNTIDPGMVDHIEVLRGPQTVLYGADAIGGVINVVTRDAAQQFSNYYQAGQWTHRYSSADNGYATRWNIEGSTTNASMFAGGGYGNINNLDRGGNLGRQPWTDYSHYSGDIKFNYLVDEQHMLTVALQHYEQEDVARSDRHPNRLTVFDPQQRSLIYMRYQGANLPYLFDRYAFTVSYHRQREGSRDHKLSTTNLDVGEVDNHTFGLSWLMSTDLWECGQLTYGFDHYHDEVNAFKNRFDSTTGSFVETRTPSYPDDGVYEQTGAFLQWDVDLSTRLSAVAGVRYSHIAAAATPIVDVDHDSDPGTPDVPTPVNISPTFDNWSASVGLNYQVDEQWLLVGSISEGFRAPNLDDLAATNDNVQQSSADTPSIDLHPEQSLSYDIGLKLKRPCLRAEFYYFWMNIDDMILRTPAGSSGSTTLFSRSNRDAHINGLEWSAQYDLVNNWTFYGQMSYYLGTDLIRNEPLSRIPPTQGVLGLRWQDPCRSQYFDFFAWLVRRQDRLNFQDISDTRIPDGGTPGYATFNLRWSSMFSDTQRITLELENLLDRAYRVHGSGVDGAGISVNIGYERLF
ncbi:MAG: TonB-dependent receptor [Pirellulaceae bacterium]